MSTLPVGPLLAEFFLARSWDRHRSGTATPRLTPETIASLQARPWRGNVRELQNVIEHVADPVAFLKAIAVALPPGRVGLVLETPSVDWIFQGEVLQDVFYEHCNYFRPSPSEPWTAICFIAQQYPIIIPHNISQQKFFNRTANPLRRRSFPTSRRRRWLALLPRKF